MEFLIDMFFKIAGVLFVVIIGFIGLMVLTSTLSMFGSVFTGHSLINEVIRPLFN